MDSQIEGLTLQVQAATQDVPGLVGGLAGDQFNWVPAPGRWSIGQCLEHLNITTERYLPVFSKAIAEARASGRTSQVPLTLGFFERWFLQSMEPPARMKFKAPKAFVATTPLPVEATVARWNTLQAAFSDCIRSAEGLDFRRVKVRSQFGPISFSLGGTFLILLAHERRHLWQAKEVRTDGGFPNDARG